MKRLISVLCAMSLVLFFTSMASAFTIENPSFEYPDLDGDAPQYTLGEGIPGWTTPTDWGLSQDKTGVWKPPSDHLVPVHGDQVAFSSGTERGWMYQDVAGLHIEAGATYCLEVYVGSRSNKDFLDDYNVSLRWLEGEGKDAVQTTIAEFRNLDEGGEGTPESGGWKKVTVVFTAEEGADYIGKQLRIVLAARGSDGQIAWDDVSLDVSSAVPEPATLLLLGGGLVGLAGLGRKKFFRKRS